MLSPFHRYHMHVLILSGNYANYGGAIYVADNTNSGACSPANECFIQTFTLYRQQNVPTLNTVNLLFSNNI